jgi:branched-chain amino acid aminotransferase
VNYNDLMASPIAYLNGRFVPFADAALPLHDAGFAFGATVVDNARTFRQKLFRWPDHLARFRGDCEACFVALEPSDNEITAAAEELVVRNAASLPPGGELQLVTFATPGPLGFYLGSAATGPPTFGMVTYPLPVGRYRSFFADGVSLAVIGHRPADAGDVLPPRVKHRSRMAWWIAEHRPRPPGTVAIVTDRPGGTLTETSFANFLAVFDGVVTSPPREMVLDGISLRVVEELCRELGIPIAEQEVPASAASCMGEAFLVGTGFCIAGVRRIDGVALSWPGQTFRRLLAAWSGLVGMDVDRQFLGERPT